MKQNKKQKKKICYWCGESYWEKRRREHECPEIFIDEIDKHSILIRCKDTLDLQWEDEKLIIWNNKK